MADKIQPLDWNDEDRYWQQNYSSRPYATGREYEHLRPGYRYGYEAAHRYRGRDWNDVEMDLRTGWDKYEHRSKSTWEEIKDAVRDGWNRLTGHRTMVTK
jgi:hypothetical protein